jgi:hypothetical protein
MPRTKNDRNGTMHTKTSDTRPIGSEQATVQAEKLFGFFPQSGASDPQLFMAGTIQVLSHYPAWLVEKIIDPFEGLPSKYEFFPSIMKLKEECEVLWQRFCRDQERELRIERQLNQRLLTGPEEVRENRLNYEQLKAKYGKDGDWGIDQAEENKRWKPLTPAELQALCTKDEWDKIPDAKTYWTPLAHAAVDAFDALSPDKNEDAA